MTTTEDPTRVPSPSTPRARPRNHRPASVALLAIVGLLALAGASLAACSSDKGSDQVGSGAEPTTTTTTLIPKDVTVTPSVKAVTATPGAQLGQVAINDGQVWVIGTAKQAGATPDPTKVESRVWRIDPATGKVIESQVVANEATTGLAAEGGELWTTAGTGHRGTMFRILADGSGTKLPLDDLAAAIAAGEGGVWAVTSNGGQNVVYLASPRADQLTIRTQLDPKGSAAGIAAGAGAVWVLISGYPSSKLVRLDPREGKVVATIDIPYRSVGSLVAAPGGAWMIASNAAQEDGTNTEAKTLLRVDATNNELDPPVKLPISAEQGMTIGDGALWTLGSQNGGLAITRIDAGTRKVTNVFWVDPKVDVHAGGFLAENDGVLWVRSLGEAGADHLIGIGPLVN